MKKNMMFLCAMLIGLAASAKSPITLFVCDTMGVSVGGARVLIGRSAADGRAVKLPKELRGGVRGDANGVIKLTDLEFGDRLAVGARGYVQQVLFLASDTTRVVDSTLSVLRMGTQSNVFTVVLSPAAPDMIDTGYGSIPVWQSTTAVSQTRTKDIQGDMPVLDMLSFLQRAAPGVTINKVGNEYVFQVRGMGSINGGDSALVLVDGVEGSISMLNPQDIASVTVCKDAASTAIYGGRAAFGAVLIKTKRGGDR